MKYLLLQDKSLTQVYRHKTTKCGNRSM